MDVQEQRVSFVVAASRGEKPLSSLCREFGISRPTGYLWLARYREQGLAGIAERSRRPVRSPERTTAEMEERVMRLRLRYPDWGARKLQVLLRQGGVELARSTIHRILLRHGLMHDSQRQGSALQRFEREAPNQLWQMDFKGPLCPAERVGPLSVLDDHSRYVVVLQKVGKHQRRPDAGTLAGRILGMRSAGGNADGPRDSLVERAVAAGFYQTLVVADEARHRAALGTDSPSPDPGQGRALPWRVATSPAMAAAASGPAGLVG